jgi:hypothetical protein
LSQPLVAVHLALTVWLTLETVVDETLLELALPSFPLVLLLSFPFVPLLFFALLPLDWQPYFW